MPIPFAINGFGRIGRALARIAHLHPDLELVAINDRAPASALANLLRNDSIHGRHPAVIEATDDHLRIDQRDVRVWQCDDPADIPWHEATTTPAVVVEATGQALERQSAARHLRPAGGPRKVIISAISQQPDLLICQGINDDAYNPRQHHVLSTASCTTHCFALLVDVLHRSVGVERALMNEVHSYTGNQQLTDGVHADPRRARAAAINIVPTTSAAPGAVEQLLPALHGRLSGMAIRVPTPNVALLEMVAVVEKPCQTEFLRQLFRSAANGRLAGLLATSEEPLVSSDYVGNTHSAIVDLELTEYAGDRMCRVIAWYDNEWGYANRLAEMVATVGAHIPA